MRMMNKTRTEEFEAAVCNNYKALSRDSARVSGSCWMSEVICVCALLAKTWR